MQLLAVLTVLCLFDEVNLFFFFLWIFSNIDDTADKLVVDEFV